MRKMVSDDTSEAMRRRRDLPSVFDAESGLR